MKAIVYSEYGTPDVLSLKNVEMPVPRADEVLIRVYAAAINSWDWDLLRGKPFLTRIGGISKPRYPILGADVSGMVEAVGENVTLYKPGDEVFGDLSGCTWGGFAEYVCAKENVLVRKPSTMTFIEAAAIPQAGVLALQGLRYRGGIRKGDKVLINGGGGGVGTFAIQLAKASGAEVTGVDHAVKLEIMRSLGAHDVVNYRQKDFTRSGKCYDRILDVTAQKSMLDYTRSLKPGGVYVMIGGASSRIFQLMLFGHLISTTTSKRMGLLIHRPERRDLEILVEHFLSGMVKPVIDKCYPLSETAEALRYFGEGLARGKVVIKIHPH